MEIPSNTKTEKLLFSTYKNGHTLKNVVGASLGGLMTFSSETFAGSTYDRQVIEK